MVLKQVTRDKWPFGRMRGELARKEDTEDGILGVGPGEADSDDNKSTDKCNCK